MKFNVKDFLPFSSQNKYSVCQIEENGIPLTLFKGAPEMILRNCRSYLDETGEELPFVVGSATGDDLAVQGKKNPCAFLQQK